MRRVPGVLATAALLTLAAACGSSDSGSGGGDGGGGGDSSKPIIIGAAVAQSGGFELYDDGQTAGMKYAIDKINAAGGVKGRKFELITADHKTDPAQVQTAAQDVLDKGADVVVTTVDYDFGAPAALAARRAQKVSISGAGATEFGLKGLGPLHFNVYQGTPTESVSMAQLAYDTQKLRKPYLLEDTTIQYSKSLCDEFEKAWDKVAGAGSIAGKDTFKNSDPAIASQVSKIKASQADFVVLCSYPPGGASAIRQLRTAGVNTPIFGGSAFDGTFWTKAVPDLSDFYHPAMTSSAGDDPNKGVNDLLAAVKFAGSASYVMFGYEIIETIKRGVEIAGTADGPALAKAIETFKDEPLLTGPTSYSPTCHAPI
ncbi:MAG TPA: ABC transporter substrate-binding protein, partial [Mycobacteriales bacterium]|nr:ABC transporter substrate-binding protein [Mycobacteriales bacterium]